jgi:tyrosine-protein phosphatase SIW14
VASGRSGGAALSASPSLAALPRGASSIAGGAAEGPSFLSLGSASTSTGAPALLSLAEALPCSAALPQPLPLAATVAPAATLRAEAATGAAALDAFGGGGGGGGGASLPSLPLTASVLGGRIDVPVRPLPTVELEGESWTLPALFGVVEAGL